MITINNYFAATAPIDFTAMPAAIKEGHEFIRELTAGANDWSAYHADATIKETVDIYLQKLNDIQKKGSEKSPPAEKANRKTRTTRQTKPAKEHNSHTDTNTTEVERIPEEIRFIKRYVNLNGKTKTKEELLRFINSLQKAILEKRIRKASPYSKQVEFIQHNLIDMYNKMHSRLRIDIDEKTISEFKALAGGEKVLLSVTYLKKYINLNGKTGIKEKVKALIGQIKKAVSKGTITKQDRYAVMLNQAYENLVAYEASKKQTALVIEQQELNGLEGVLGCACQPLNRLEKTPVIMNSLDFVNMEFATLGFTGKWRDFIGDPSKNFTAMVYGKPKFGKSYLCIDFAGYLARNHGKVLYVAKEEHLDYTLQEKLRDKNVAHANLTVAAILPDNLSSYDFVFLDSVNKLNLSPEDLNCLRIQNTGKSFVFIFQTTKTGNFRGANTFQHDVDVVIEVPERGKAVQMGRFNQGGELDIFQ
jgi:hypothetical protein